VLALYVGWLGEVTAEDVRETEDEVAHMPAYYQGREADFWFRLFDIRRLVDDDTPAVIQQTRRLLNRRYNDRPVSLYGGMVELPLIVTHPDDMKWFADRDLLTGDALWAVRDAEMRADTSRLARDLPENLLGLYFSSIGRNSKLLLNVPPNRDGLFDAPDVAALQGFHARKSALFAHDLLRGARVRASSGRDPEAVLDPDPDRHWQADANARSGWLEFYLPAPVRFDVLRVAEAIAHGQHIGAWRLQLHTGSAWRTGVRDTPRRSASGDSATSCPGASLPFRTISRSRTTASAIWVLIGPGSSASGIPSVSTGSRCFLDYPGNQFHSVRRARRRSRSPAYIAVMNRRAVMVRAVGAFAAGNDANKASMRSRVACSNSWCVKMYRSLRRMPSSTRSPASTGSRATAMNLRIMASSSAEGALVLGLVIWLTSAAGRILSDSMRLDFTKPGQNTETPTLAPANSSRSDSIRPMIANFEVM
jgi:hypothetical protein